MKASRFLRDALGVRRRDSANNFILQAQDRAATTLLIPKRFRREGLAFNRVYIYESISRLPSRKTTASVLQSDQSSFEYKLFGNTIAP